MPGVSTYPKDMACCTCATLLSNVFGHPRQQRSDNDNDDDDNERWNEKSDYILSEKHDGYNEEDGLIHFQMNCCGRYMCAVCVENNPRFTKYCPFCPSKFATDFDSSSPLEQHSTTAQSDLPPSYSISEPPPYTSTASITSSSPNSSPLSGSIKHFLLPTDTLPILSLRYTTPLSILRSHNRIFSDHLLAGRSYILIPRAYYTGPSFSPDPIQSEEENMLKKFQLRTKCVEWDVAKVYLEETKWDLEKAIVRWDEDERWEREQNVRGLGKGKQKEVVEKTMRKRGLFS